MFFQDIEGTSPNPKIIKPRKEDIYTYIEGSSPKKLTKEYKNKYDSLNVKDINEFKQF